MNYIDPFENKTENKEAKEQKIHWINTYSGRKFNLLNPHIDSIVIQDIARPLSKICRFNGHIKDDGIYSVAQHCINVSYICDKAWQLQGLLHDAAEALIGDCSHPLKHSGMMDNYIKIEKNIQTLIYRRFGVSEIENQNVKEADMIMLATEARDLLEKIHPDWKMGEVLPFKIVPMQPKEAEEMYLNRFNELFLANEKLKNG